MMFLTSLKGMLNPWTYVVVLFLALAGTGLYTKALIESNAVAKSTIDTMIEADKRKTERLLHAQELNKLYETERESNRVKLVEKKITLIKDEKELQSQPIEVVREYVIKENMKAYMDIVCVSGDKTKCEESKPSQ